MIKRLPAVLAVAAAVAFTTSGAPVARRADSLRARAIEARRLAEKALHLEIRMSMRLLRDAVVGEEFRGYLLGGEGSFEEVEDPGLALVDAFEEAGWVAVPEYQSDGADGTAGAYEKPGIRCLYEIGWNGHVDGEPDSLAAETPGRRDGTFRVNIFCYRQTME
jgi:hypothetical protein